MPTVSVSARVEGRLIGFAYRWDESRNETRVKHRCHARRSQHCRTKRVSRPMFHAPSPKYRRRHRQKMAAWVDFDGQEVLHPHIVLFYRGEVIKFDAISTVRKRRTIPPLDSS